VGRDRERSDREVRSGEGAQSVIQKAMVGYSGTPLSKKLGVRPGFRVHLANAPVKVRAELRAVLIDCDEKRVPTGPLDFVMVFSKSPRNLAREFGKVIAFLTPAGMMWACWPKKSSGVESELDEHRVREIGLRADLVDVKVCAITETWSGLKFVRRSAERGRIRTRASA
jgi:hypothetical protein